MKTWQELTSAAKERKREEEQRKQKKPASWDDLRRKALSREVDEKYVQSYITDSRNYFSQAEKDYGGLNWESATNKDANSARKTTADDLQARARKIRAYYELNKGSIDETAYSDMLSYLDDTDKLYGDVIDRFDKASQYFALFEGQDHYDVMNMSLDEIQAQLAKGGKVAYTTKGGQNITWQQLYDNAVQQKDLEDKTTQFSANADWAEYGRSDYTTTDIEADFQTAYGLAIENAPATWQEAQRKGYTQEQFNTIDKQRKYLSEKYGANTADLDALNDLTNNLNEISQYVDHMTDDEKRVLSYMFRTEGAEKAVEWFSSRRYLYEERMAGKVSEDMAAYSKGKPVLGSLRALGNTMLSPIEYAADMLRYAGTDEKFYNMSAQRSSALKSGVMDQYDWQTGNVDWFDFLYGTAMSGAESIAAMLTGGPFAGLSLGMSAAAQTTNDAFARGMDKKQAVVTGIAAGVTEMLFESFSIENFNALKQIPAAHIKDIALNIGKNMLVNASEETLTELANLVYDDIANGDFSQWETNYRQRVSNGEDPKEARRHAWGDAALQVGEATASGALMGFGFGVTGSGRALAYNAGKAVGAARQNRAMAQDIMQKDGGVAQLQGVAAEAAALPDTGMQGKLERRSAKVAENATTGNVRSLYKTVGKAFDAQSQADIAQALESKGIDAKNAKALAAAIVADSNGKILTDKQSNLLDQYSTNKAVQSTISDMVVNRQSTLNQRKASLAGLTGKNTLTRAFMQKGVEKATAEKLAEVVVAVENGQKLPAPAQELADSVKKNPKLNAAVQLASVYVNSTAEEAFNNMEADYAGSNTVIANMPQVQKNAFLSLHDPKVNTNGGEYAHAMAAAYSLGYNNRGMDNLDKLVDGPILKTLTKEQRMFAWEAGREVDEQDANKADENIKATYQQAQEVLKQKGQDQGRKYHAVAAAGVNVKKMDKQQKASYELAQKIAPAVKADIIAYNGGKEWGYYNHETDTIHINVNAKWSEASMMTYTMAHELVHRAKKGSYKQFKAFADFLMEQYGKQGADVDEMIGQQMAAADAFDKTVPESQRINMTPEMALEEVICDAAQRMLLDTNAGEKLARWGAQSKQNRDFLVKIKKIITDLLNRLRSYFKNVDPESLPAKEFAKIDANAKQILADMFVEMSIDAGEKLSTIKEAGLLNKNTATEGGRQYKTGYDYTKSFEQQIDDFKAGLIPDRDTLIIGATPKIYQAIGFNPLPMTINKTHVEYALYGTKNAEHHIGETMLKQLPKALEKPIAVVVSQSAPTTSVVVLVSLQHNGEQVIAPVYLDGAGRKNGVSIDSNAVTSVHGRGNAIKGLLKNALNEEAKQNIGVFYWDKKAATALLTTAGVTMPQGLSLSDGYVHSIREKNSPVKPKFNNVTETQQFKRWFGDWQNHPENASKIVNADGTPKLMYHGSPAQFTIFDKRKAKSSGQYGRGFYFTDSQSHASTYGQQYSVYLNIRNPLQHGGGTVSRLQVQKFLEAVVENEDYSIENYGTYDVDTVVQNIMGKTSAIDAFQLIQDVSLTAIGDMVEAAELFNKVNGTKFDGIIAATETVAFYPEQIKSATDNIGTFDKTNPDIRYKVPVDAKSPTYEELVAKDPIAVVDVGRNVDGLSYAELKKQVLQNAEARKLFDVPHLNSDTEISIFLTPSSFTHAFSNLTADFGVDTILAMDHIDEIIHEAILTHIDDPRNPAKAENRVFTFFAAIEGENGIEPIKLKVKEYAEDNFERLPRNIRSYFEKNGIITPHNRLYDAVALEVVAVESAKKESGASASGTESETQSVAKGTPNSTIKIADLLGLVNGDAKKYIPNRNDKSLKLPVGDAAQQRQAGKETLSRYQEALRGQKSDTKIMEQEFARLARVFETQARRSGKKDVAIDDLKTALKAEAKKHRDDQKLWEAEFNRLLRAYETSGRKIDRLESQVAQQRQAAKDKVEGHRKTEMRHKIIRFKEKLQVTLQRPTENSYVPVDLISAMVDVCELIDNDSPLYKTDGSLNKAQAERDATRDRLLALKDEYSKLKASDPIYAGEFDEMVEAYLDELRQNFTGKSLKDMSLMELGEMYEILRSIDETLQDARKLIDFGGKADVYEAGDSIIDEQRGITKSRKNGHRNKAERLRDTNFNYTLSPIRNVERMSGYHRDSFLLRLFKKFEQGIRKKNKFMMDAYQLFEKLTSGKEYDDALYNEVGGKKYEDVNGRKFGISKMQMMQAILSFEREVANGHNHIQKGGFTFADLDKLKKGKLGEAITEEYAHRIPAAFDLINEFTEILQGDKWCQQYMEAARTFFNGMAKKAINETSIAWKHRVVAQEKSYIPYEVDKNFVMNEISAANNIQETINAYGMLKATQDKAPQPLIMTGLNNILDRHIEKVGSVYGLAIPVRNFNKVWNMRSNSIDGNPTVKSVIELNWGKEGIKHIEQAVQDIQGPRKKNQSALYRKVKSNYIGATFLLNLSVVTKQIGSLFSAVSMLRWRGPIRMLGNLFTTMVNHKKIAAEVNQYTASAWMRRQGVSDAELHTLMTEAKKSWVGKQISKLPSVLHPGKWIAAMDYTVALSLWKYAKIDTAKKTGLKGEELLQTTAEFYDELIESTQSMTDVLHRPEVQKRGDVLSDAFGMFKTDLYQMAGQLETTIGRFAAEKSAENGRALGRTIYAVAMSAVWGQLMTTVFALLRYKVNPYRDEEDEDLTVESWLKRQGYALGGDLLAYIFPLLGSEFVGFLENVVYGESEDFADSIALTAVNDLYDTMVTIGSKIEEGESLTLMDWRKLGSRALQIMGVPSNNILRTWDAIKLHAEDMKNGEWGSFEAGAKRTPANHAHRILEAIDGGNMNTAKALYDDAIEDIAGLDATDEEKKAAKSKVKSALGEKYKDGLITKNLAEKFLKDILGESEDDIYWIFDKWEYGRANNSQEGYAKYDDFFVAVETGENLRKTIKTYTDNGVSQQTLKSQITSHFKAQYLSLPKSKRLTMRGYLINAFVMCGDTREEAMKKIDNWE